MKYAKFSDYILSYFRLDDNGETLVLTDRGGLTRAVKLLPYEERTQGEWIKNEGKDIRDNFYTCSKCGRTVNVLCGETLADYPFCHCGADMRQETEKEPITRDRLEREYIRFLEAKNGMGHLSVTKYLPVTKYYSSTCLEWLLEHYDITEKGADNE